MKKTVRSILLCLMMVALIFLAEAAFADTLTLPASLTEIDAEVFMGDTSLDTVIIPSGVTEIPSAAFAGSSLKTIHIPASLTEIADDAFAGAYPVYVVSPKGNFTMTEISAGSTTAEINNPGDYVKFRFEPNASGNYTLTSAGSEDTYGTLYDASGKLLMSDDDSGEGYNFSITYDFTAGTVYYFAVRFHFSSTTGTVPLVLSNNTASSKYRALCVGNEDYRYISDTPGCCNDMEAMAGMLRHLTNSFAVSTLRNATAAQIREKIGTAFEGAAEDSVSLFFYAGHGMNTNADAYLGSLVGANYSNYYPGDYITTGELASLLSKIPGRVIVVLDSCHSGATISGRGTDDPLDKYNQSVIDAFAAYDNAVVINGSNARTQEMKKSKFVVITAASPSESSSPKRVGDMDVGVFSYHFVTGCGALYPSGSYMNRVPADTNGDFCVSAYEIYKYAHDMALKDNKNQHAMYYAADPNEILFRRD